MNKILTSSLVIISLLVINDVMADYFDINKEYYYGLVKYVNRFVRHSINNYLIAPNIVTNTAYHYHTPVTSFSFGRKTETGLRFDVEFVKGSVQKIGSEQVKEHVDTISFNLYYDFVNKSVFTPYLGVGGGLALLHSVKLGLPSVFPDTQRSTSNLYYQIGAGFSIAVNKIVNLDFGYRYADYGKDITTVVGTSHATQILKGNDLFVGLRFKF